MKKILQLGAFWVGQYDNDATIYRYHLYLLNKDKIYMVFIWILSLLVIDMSE